MIDLDDGVTRIPIQLTRGCLVASIQVDLSREVLRRFQQDLLDRIASSQTRGVILDVSGVEIMDADDFGALSRACEMARIMGARSVMVGLRPGVVAALVDLNGGELAAIVDGLGHGESAHDVASKAVRFIRSAATSDLASLMGRLSAHLEGTIGAAVALSHTNGQAGSYQASQTHGKSANHPPP